MNLFERLSAFTKPSQKLHTKSEAIKTGSEQAEGILFVSYTVQGMVIISTPFPDQNHTSKILTRDQFKKAPAPARE
ncbi:hypothetical protein X474_26805 [Dethiosulfatarculus sandiegensis]|uniref:Uncharacterized protein n=1 Tax=Dethiosulfatarculus sandiegensis TaxID=1429043 RepID=A0A0D2IY86_9BACT|nr:hypothetical protein X474_26805 [Dethiosulfatarculus sandiegensis]